MKKQQSFEEFMSTISPDIWRDTERRLTYERGIDWILSLHGISEILELELNDEILDHFEDIWAKGYEE